MQGFFWVLFEALGIIWALIFAPIQSSLSLEIHSTPSGIPGGGVGGLIFAGYVLLASQSPYPIIVYSVANYRPHLSQFWVNV